MSKFCTNCGQELDENMKFCLNCGQEINIENKIVSEKKSYNTSKSKIAAGLLGILLGSLGVHNFYLGYKGKGTAQLLITLLSFGTLSLISSIWGLVEGILILTGSINTDSEGNPLSE